MNRIYLWIILLAPGALFAQDYRLTPAGVSFMAAAWASIIIWNLVCFGKILKNRGK